MRKKREHRNEGDPLECRGACQTGCGNAFDPVPLLCLGKCLVDDALLQEVKFTRFWIRFLFKRRQENGVQIRVVPFNAPGQVLIVRPPVICAAHGQHRQDNQNTCEHRQCGDAVDLKRP